MTAGLEIQFCPRISDIPEASWNELSGAAGPFLRHAFLKALEDSGSVSTDTGWTPHHLMCTRHNTPVAVMPLYIKTHSYGEYVFDWSWADAYYRAGLSYYPKFLTAIPFTPSVSARVLIAPSEHDAPIYRAISDAVMAEAHRVGASSWHVLFPPREQSEKLVGLGLMQRQGTQFQWFNRGYRDFQHYLEQFSSRKRKNVNKEREAIRHAGITFEHLTGHDIDDGTWARFFAFYQNTYHVRGQQGYLEESFFHQLGETMPESLFLVQARLHGKVIAAALSFQDKEALYGRYWGYCENYDSLHFETCYYQGIDHCIAKGLARFDSGAQGEHKIARGFEPIDTYSAHWLANPEFARAVKDFLRRETSHVEQYRHDAALLLPFKRQ